VDALLQRLAAHRGPGAYGTVFALIAGSGLGIPINEDVVILGAGALTLYGVFDARLLIATVLIGLLIADGLIYYWGRRFGAALLLKRPFSYVISPAQLLSAQKRFEGGGAGLIFATRFLAGLRAPIHFTAGTLKISYRTFVMCDMGAAVFEVPVLIFAVRFVGGHVDRVLPYVKRFEYAALAAFGVWLLLRIKRYWLPVNVAPVADIEN